MADQDTEPMTRRQFLIEQVIIEMVGRGEHLTIFDAAEAVSSTAIEHPEWNMDEVKTRSEWLKELQGRV